MQITNDDSILLSHSCGLQMGVNAEKCAGTCDVVLKAEPPARSQSIPTPQARETRHPTTACPHVTTLSRPPNELLEPPISADTCV